MDDALMESRPGSGGAWRLLKSREAVGDVAQDPALDRITAAVNGSWPAEGRAEPTAGEMGRMVADGIDQWRGCPWTLAKDDRRW